MINKKFLKKKDTVHFTDLTSFHLSKSALVTFEENFDEERITHITRLLSNKSEKFIGIMKSESDVDKIVFWLTPDKKYATSKFKLVSNENGVRNYNIILWENSAIK